MNMRNDREGLVWLISVAERDLSTEAARTEFLRDCVGFVKSHNPGGAVLGAPGKNFTARDVRNAKPKEIIKGLGRDDRRDATEWMQEKIQSMLKEASSRQKRIQSPYSEWQSLYWDETKQRYEPRPDYRFKDLAEAILMILYGLIRQHGHLIHACEAPAPRKPGRKLKDAPVENGTCGTIFLSERTTGAYCSDTCRNRVLMRSRREKISAAVANF
jgi:hypothetical protein